MSESSILVVGGALLCVLALFLLKIVLTAHALQQEPEETRGNGYTSQGCPAEIAERIFSDEDRNFIEELKSASVERLFGKERKKVALLWVRQTAAVIRRVMREHTEAARRSADVQLGTELRLLAQYAGSMAVCGALLVLIQLAGPLWLHGLAGYAQGLSQRIADGQRAWATQAVGEKI